MDTVDPSFAMDTATRERWRKILAVLATMSLLWTMWVPTVAQATTVTSSDGKMQVEYTASPTTLPTGGGQVTPPTP